MTDDNRRVSKLKQQIVNNMHDYRTKAVSEDAQIYES